MFTSKRLTTLLTVLVFVTSPISGESVTPLTLDNLLQNLSITPNASSTPQPSASRTRQGSPSGKSLASRTITAIKFSGFSNENKTTAKQELSIKVGDTINDFKLERNIKNLENIGVFKSVTGKILPNGSNAIIQFTAVENPNITEIQFIGNKTYDSITLFPLIESKVGKPYNLNKVRNDIKSIENYYHENGYIQAKVFRLENPDDTNGKLIFHLAEGIIENFSITGNTKTRDYVILRELNIEPGQAINSNELQQNLRRVFNLNYFTEVKPNLKPSRTSPNAYDLELELVERETNGSFSFGGGYSPSSGFSLFSDLFWDNIFGTGQLIMLKGNFGLGTGQAGRTTTYQFKYHNPWMWDKRKSLTLRTWYTNGDFNSISSFSNGVTLRNEARRGIDVAVGIPHTYDFRSSHKVKYESVFLGDIPDGYYIYSYTLGLGYDTRDYRMNPREGVYHTFSVEQGLKFRLNAVDFTRFDLTFRKFIPTFKKQALALRAEYGYLRSPELVSTTRFANQLYRVGGSYSVRGYDDFYPFANGHAQAVYSIEYRHLFNQDFVAYLFADTGYAANSGVDVMNKLDRYQVGKGVGVLFNVPGLGPIRLDFGMDDLGESRIHFNVGHAF